MLNAGASCGLPIDFIPAAIGGINGSAVLTDNNDFKLHHHLGQEKPGFSPVQKQKRVEAPGFSPGDKDVARRAYLTA